jgi:hypothetical protein
MGDGNVDVLKEAMEEGSVFRGKNNRGGSRVARDPQGSLSIKQERNRQEADRIVALAKSGLPLSVIKQRTSKKPYFIKNALACAGVIPKKNVQDYSYSPLAESSEARHIKPKWLDDHGA